MASISDKLKKEIKEKVKVTSNMLNKLKIEAKETYQILKEFISQIEDEDLYVVKYKELAPFPIVLIHGYMSGEDCWKDYIPLFEQIGYKSDQNLFNFAFSSEEKPANGDIIEYAKLLADTIEKIMKETKKEKVILVVHSMGGLISRYFIEKMGGAEKVHRLIMLGTPNRGSGPLPQMRKLFINLENKVELGLNEIKVLLGKDEEEKDLNLLGKAADMMKPGSEFLETLGYKARPNFYLIAGIKGLPKILEIPNDGAVELKSAILDEMGENHIQKLKVNHFELHKSLKVFNRMMEFIIE